MGEKKTSDTGATRVHLYCGAGLPTSDLQLRVTFPFRSARPDMEHTGGDGGTERRTHKHTRKRTHEHARTRSVTLYGSSTPGFVFGFVCIACNVCV